MLGVCFLLKYKKSLRLSVCLATRSAVFSTSQKQCFIPEYGQVKGGAGEWEGGNHYSSPYSTQLLCSFSENYNGVSYGI